jgi:hypothetical protein
MIGQWRRNISDATPPTRISATKRRETSGARRALAWRRPGIADAMRNVHLPPLAASVLVIGACLPPALHSAAPVTVALAARAALPAHAMASLAGEPLRFEENRGQVSGNAAFVARGHGYTAYMTPSGITLSMHSAVPGVPWRGGVVRRATIRLTFAGANHRPTMVGMHRLPGISNYFIGMNARGWRTGVPAFGEVSYHDLYPGVDAVFYDGGHGLEYDLRVAPGVDPASIRLNISGGSTSANGSGLHVRTAAGNLRIDAPRLYQNVGSRRLRVPGRFVPRGSGISFAIGAYDHKRTLVIDPTIVYSTYLGGTGDDLGNGIAVDGRGQSYITGETTSLDFPATTSGAQAQYGGGGNCADYYTCGDAFVAKLSADGHSVLYRTYLGGRGNDGAWTVALDGRGNAYIEGRTLSPDFPIVHGFQPGFAVGSDDSMGDAFVARLSADGTKLLCSTYLGGTGNDQALSVAVDRMGHAFVTGYTSSRDFPLAHPFQAKNRSARGDATVFVSELSADGRALLYSTYLGGSEYESASAIAVDSRGNAYITGSTQSADFPLSHALQRFSSGHLNGFLAELSANGGTLRFSTYLGGRGETVGTSVALDSSDQIYVAGSTAAGDLPTRHAIQRQSGGTGAIGWGDVFLARFSPGGKSLLASTYLGGKGDEQALGIALDSRGDVWLAGATTSANFPTMHATQRFNHTARSCRERMPYDPARTGYQPFTFSCADVFVTELGRGGATLRYSTYLGGALGDGADFIAADTSGNVYMIGSTRSQNFPVVKAVQPGAGGGSDTFVVKIHA